MKRIWPFAMCIGLVVQQQNVRREVWPPPGEPQQAVAKAPAPPPKVLDPVLVELPERSTVMQVRKQLDKDNPGRARELAEAALASEGYNSIALAHLDTLGTFNHPLSRWAKLKRASLLQRKDPVTAAQIAASLTDNWAGRSRARSIEIRTGGTSGSGAHLEIRLDGKPPALARQPSVRPRMQQNLDKAESLYSAKRYREAERLFGKLIKHLKTGTVVWCKARYKQGRALLQARERTRGAP
ncbi:MAG: hypothetical protein JRD94_00335, partial [Deltaproteobacteria bacterium]|nr:hypothetical protein [Deltaproteobacteria bacterium]